MNALLQSRGLSKSYTVGKDNDVSVLKGVDLDIHEGEFVSVMGPSGSGKSTLLYNICGMDRMSGGSVLFRGRELSGLSEKELAVLRLNEMGFIFQQIHLLRNLTVFDNIILSGYLAGGRSRKAVDRRARELMELTGIAPLAQNAITQASGGQLQRVGICRALINEPDILFADEPTGALDSKSAAEIMELLQRINDAGTTIMLVTHDIRVASKSERVLFMMDGRITAEKKLGKPGRHTATGNLGAVAGDNRAAGTLAAGGSNGTGARAREEELTGWLIEQGL